MEKPSVHPVALIINSLTKAFVIFCIQLILPNMCNKYEYHISCEIDATIT